MGLRAGNGISHVSLPFQETGHHKALDSPYAKYILLLLTPLSPNDVYRRHLTQCTCRASRQYVLERLQRA